MWNGAGGGLLEEVTAELRPVTRWRGMAFPAEGTAGAKPRRRDRAQASCQRGKQGRQGCAGIRVRLGPEYPLLPQGQWQVERGAGQRVCVWFVQRPDGARL